MHPGRIRVGISSCLIGEPVRYDGGHKRDACITKALSRYFEFVPFCPEVAIGLGVPRATIQLRSTRRGTRAIQTGAGKRDVTDELASYGRAIAITRKDLSGYIFKARSPSCGVARVRVHGARGARPAFSSGIYALAFKEARLLPTEDEERLADPGVRENFLERVFVCYCWQRMLSAGPGAALLPRFHENFQPLIAAHSRAALHELGRIAASPTGDIDDRAAAYFSRLMQALSRRVRRGRRAGAMRDIAGNLAAARRGADRIELANAISAYQKQELPIIAPLTLIGRRLRRLETDELQAAGYKPQKRKS